MAELPIFHQARNDSPDNNKESDLNRSVRKDLQAVKDFFKDERTAAELKLVGLTKSLVLAGKYQVALVKINALIECIPPDETKIIHDTSSEALANAANEKLINKHDGDLKTMVIEVFEQLNNRTYYDARQKLFHIIATFGGSPINFYEHIIGRSEHQVGLSRNDLRFLLLGEPRKKS